MKLNFIGGLLTYLEDDGPYKSSGGKNERVLEGRARALLNKKDQLEDSIIRKEQEELDKQERLRQEQEEMKMHRTSSQKERANQVCLDY